MLRIFGTKVNFKLIIINDNSNLVKSRVDHIWSGILYRTNGLISIPILVRANVIKVAYNNVYNSDKDIYVFMLFNITF